MLPRAHENAVRYLMPMSVTAGQAAAQARSVRRNPEDSLAARRAFYYLINLVRRNLDLLALGGGYFFSNRAGETLAVDCWNATLKRVVNLLKYDRVTSLLDRTNSSDSLTKFESRFDLPEWFYLSRPGTSRHDRDFVAVFESFNNSVTEGNLDDVCDLLEIYELVTGFEVNRLYQQWYGSMDSSYVQELRTKQGSLDWGMRPEAGPDADLRQLSASIKTYIEVSTGGGVPSSEPPPP